MVCCRQEPFVQQQVSQSVREEQIHSADLMHILTSSQQVGSKLNLEKLSRVWSLFDEVKEEIQYNTSETMESDVCICPIASVFNSILSLLL